MKEEPAEIPEMKLEFHYTQFPQLTTRYTADELRDTLLRMCQSANLPITKVNMESQAAVLESDLAEMFA